MSVWPVVRSSCVGVACCEVVHLDQGFSAAVGKVGFHIVSDPSYNSIPF